VDAYSPQPGKLFGKTQTKIEGSNTVPASGQSCIIFYTNKLANQ